MIAAIAQATSEKSDLYPHWNELIMGAICFAVVYVFMAKFVIPAMNRMLDERREKIQGEMEKAESTRTEADHILSDYKAQLAGARDEANRIIEEARKTAEQLAKDVATKADEQAQATVSRAQEEIRGERDRVFQELRTQVGEIAVDLAGRVVGKELDKSAHERLIDDYIDQVSKGQGGSGN